MIRTTILPRFNDTDALGHISNTAFPSWFEESRKELFKVFHPSLDVKTWPLILARTEIDFLAQSYWDKEVVICTSIGKLGNSSCHVLQEAWQNNQMVAKGVAVLIYFDYKTNSSKKIPDDIREQLSAYLSDKT